MPVIDTSFLIDIERQHPAALAGFERLADAGQPLLVPAQVAAEYLTGIEDMVAALHQLEQAFAIVPFGRLQHLESARLARAAFARGRFPGWADAQVAALAVLEQTFVVSSDAEHFEVFDVVCWNPRVDSVPPLA